jgi:WD40 repeat protein
MLPTKTVRKVRTATKASADKSSIKFTMEKNNPFPGLRPFRYEESHLFFGREGQIDEVVKKLTDHKFVAVIGTSGIGKSSFMYCGLLPILYGDYKTEQSSQWDISICRPGIAPIKNLADALSESELKNVEEEKHEIVKNMNFLSLRGSSNGLVELVKNRFRTEQKNYLIFIDQFEELFRFKNTDDNAVDEAAAFIKLLTEAVTQTEVPIYVVVTMRSDFVGDCSQFPRLTMLINDSQFLIPQMIREEKKQAILGPVSVMGGKIDDRLVQQILNDVGDNADALPIMQHALMRTWDFWQKTGDSDSMNLGHYEAIGGMKKALSVHANEAYNELNEKQKKICEKIFKTITEKGEEGRGVRRPAKLSEIAVIASAPMEEVAEVVDHFRQPGKTLLMPPFTVKLNENSVIDISHESLMRIWVMLNKWVEEESESVKLYLRLAEAAEMHQLGKAGLWRPPDLQIALNWQAEQNPSAVWGLRYHKAYERTMLFLEFSKKEFEREQINKEKMQRRRLIAARITALILGLGAIVAFLFFIYGEQQRREAEKQKAEATKQSKIAQEQATLAHNESIKARESEQKALEQKQIAEEETEKAIESEKRAQEQKRLAELATKDALRQKALAVEAQNLALTEERKAYNLRMLSIAKSMAIKSVSLTDKEQKGLVAQQAYQFNKEHGGKDLDPDVFDAMYNATKALGDSSFKPLKGHTQNVRALSTTLTGKYIYSAGSDGKINRWDPKDANGSRQTVGETMNLVHKAMALSPNNKLLASGGDYNYLQVFDLDKIGSKPKIIKSKTTETWFVGFTPDSKGLVSVGNDKKIFYWDLESNLPTQITSSDTKINTLALSPMGSNLIIVGKANGEISIIDRDKNNEISVLHTDNASIVSLAFSKNGKLLAAGNEKGMVRIFDMTTRTLFTSLSGHTARVNNIRFNNDGDRLATGSFDKTVRLWNLLNIYDPPIVLKDHDDWVWSIEFSPDGNKLLAGCKDNQIKVWPTKIDLMKNIICDKITRNLNSKEWEQFVGDDINYRKTCLDKPKGNGVK